MNTTNTKSTDAQAALNRFARTFGYEACTGDIKRGCGQIGYSRHGRRATVVLYCLDGDRFLAGGPLQSHVPPSVLTDIMDYMCEGADLMRSRIDIPSLVC